jgi:hypothetical protein
MRYLDLPIDFKKSADGLVPVDEHLYSLAMDYCKRELAELPELRNYYKVWVSARLDDDDRPVEINGLQTLQQAIDLPVSRYSDSKAAKLLSRRVEIFMQDNGLRGSHVFVYLNSKESDAQKCRNWTDWLRNWKARPADRWLVRVR